MATVRTAIQLHDRISPVARSMIHAMQAVLGTFHSVQKASGQAVDTSSFERARAAVGRLEVEFDQMESEIKEAARAQEEFNQKVKQGKNEVEQLGGKINGMAVGMAAAFSAKKIIDLSDEMSGIRARLNLINDGMQTTAELQDKIFASANRARASYASTADAVGKLAMQAGDAFKSTDEVIAFSEQVNKTFTITGTGAHNASAAMLQLTQAMAMGKLRAQELNSLFENAQPLVQNIADYLEVPIGAIKDMAAEGQITAETIKNAMFWAAERTDERFAAIPMTYGQVWTMITNTALQAFDPLIQAIGRGAGFIYDNWETLEPIFWGLTAAVGAYVIGLGVMKAATIATTIAQMGLKAALLSNPLGWIALLIGVVIGVIYRWVQAVGGIKIAWLIAKDAVIYAVDSMGIGLAKGVFFMAAKLENMKAGVKGAGVAVQNYLGDMKVGGLQILQDFINGAIDIINRFINAVNNIPGVEIETVQQVTFAATAAIENEAAKTARNSALESYKSQIAQAQAARDAEIQRVGAMRDSDRAARQSEIAALQKEAEAKRNEAGFDYQNASNLADTANNTAKMANSMDMAEEDLKYMRDIAERDAINRFTTAEIKVEMTNHNTISSEMDLDGIVSHLESKVYETMEVAAEGVHN